MDRTIKERKLPGVTYTKEREYEILGRQLSTEKFAQKIDNLAVQGISHIVFVIGGSLGLGRNIREKSDFALSFSEMTYPHQLMRVILLEQIYRSYRIINGEPYHK